jgi:hypothetical protein
VTDGGSWQPPEPGEGPTTPPPPATPAGGLAPPSFDPPPSANPPTEPVPTMPMATVEPTTSPNGSKPRGKIIAAVIGAVAIVGAGVFAVTRVAGDSSSAGASSPEAAANDFLDALDKEDVLGLVDVLLPGERDTFRQPLQDLVGELKRLEVLSSDADLSKIGGVDIAITDRKVDVHETNVDDIVDLEVTATASATLKGEELPIGAWIRDAIGDQDMSELDETSDASESTFPITAVRKDGRWYLSAFYSLAETLRHEADDPDIPAEGVALNGGDSPEAAMDNLINAAAGLDLTKIIGALNPNEFEALQRYAPLFIADAQQELADAEVRLEVTNTAYDVTGSGDTRHVGIKGFKVDVSAPDDIAATIELKDGCLLISGDVDGEAQTINSCDDLGEIPDLETAGIDPAQLEDLQATAKKVFADYTNPGFTVKQIDGAWYVSPMATGFDQLFAVSKALTREEIEELVDQVRQFIETVADNGGFDEVPSIPGLPDYSRPGDDEGSAPTTVVPDDDEPTASTGETETSEPPVTDASDELDKGALCYGEADAKAASECFAGLVTGGDIDQSDVPWWLQHTECGASDAYWDATYFVLPDDEFVAIVDKAAPCYQALVDSGDVSEDVLPPEITNPECLEGRNPYNGGDAVLDAFYDCVFG